MRPRALDEPGQAPATWIRLCRLVGAGREQGSIPVKVGAAAQRSSALSSVIWGPPETGKADRWHLVAQGSGRRFVELIRR